MKKILVILCLLLVGCSKDDSIKTLKKEYESLNDKGIVVNIKDESLVNILDYNETKELLTSKTGIIYFGFPSCPWCRNILPILLDVAKENNVYVNYLNIRNISDEEKSELKNILADYLTLEDDELILYVPDVYFVNNGNIVAHHLGSVESQTDPYVALDKEQVDELKTIYNDLIGKMKNE